MSYQVNCSNPRLIINPQLPLLINKYRHYFFLGHERRCYFNVAHPRSFDLSPFWPKKHGVNRTNMDDCFVLDEKTGECFPMYLEVPCGKCDICKVTKQNSFVSRCRYESQCYNSMPWFGTLTYDEQNKPAEGVVVRDVQLWLKRFRIDLERAGFTQKIRYVVVGEYGTNTKRPHYHFIIWGIECKSHNDFVAVDNLLRKSWNKGFIRHRIVNMKDDKAFYYTAKYLRKECQPPEGCNPTFMLSSRKNGGIGSSFIDKHASRIRSSLDHTYQYRDKWSGKVVPFQFNRYSLNRIFPSFCRSVCSDFRSAIYDASMLIQNFGQYVNETWRHYFYDVFERIRKYVFIPYGFCNKRDPWLFKNIVFRHSDVEVDDTSLLSKFCLVDLVLSDCRIKIDKWIDKINFSRSKRLEELRKKFFARLFEFMNNIDIKQREYECMQILSWESPRTIHV